MEAKTSAHGKRNRAVAELRRHGATAETVRAAARSWPRLFPQATLTDTALAKHYPQLAATLTHQRRPSVCPECGVGVGAHTVDCPRAASTPDQDPAAAEARRENMQRLQELTSRLLHGM